MNEPSAFSILKPICVKLCDDFSKDNLKSLQSTIKHIKKCDLDSLQQYIFFPLKFGLASTKRIDDVILSTVECITQLISLTSLTTWDFFQEIYFFVIILISRPQDNGKIANVSEEVKLAVVKCITFLYKNSSRDVLIQNYQPEFRHQLGHLVFVLLRLAENESYKQLRIESVECLLVTALAHRKDDDELRKQASQAFTSCLPGISVTLTKIITGNIIQGKGITVVALKCFAEVISLVMSDANIANIDDKPNEIRTDLKFLIIVRDDSWLKDTALKLKILIEKISDKELVCLDQHHWHVRLSLTDCAGTLLLECNNSLEICSDLLLNILITLTSDERETVANCSCEWLRKCLHRFRESRQLLDKLKENVHTLIIKLPRLFHVANDEKKLSTLRLLIGYVQLLVLINENGRGFFLSYPQMSRLGQALMQLVELDCSNTQILTEKSIDHPKANDTQIQTIRACKKIFKHFQDQRIFDNFQFLCRLLGRYTDFQLLIDHCLDLFHNSIIYRNQAVIVIKELVIGAGGSEREFSNFAIQSLDLNLDQNSSFVPRSNSTEILFSVVKMLLEEYLEPSIWFLPVSFDVDNRIDFRLNATEEAFTIVKTTPKDDESLTLYHVNNNIWLFCIILESIASFSQVLKSEFNVLLIQVLYPLLEKMSSSSALISHSAYFSASVISKSVSCNSVADLIHSNGDYIVNALCVKLRHIEQNPEAPRVMKTVFENSGPEKNILALVQDSMEELLNSLDNFHQKTSYPFMDVLNSLNKSFLLWYPSTKITGRTQTAQKETKTTLAEYLNDFITLKNIAEGDLDGDVDAETSLKDTNKEEMENIYKTHTETKEDENEEDKEKNKPLFIKFSSQTLERCVHLLPKKSQNFALLLLDTVELCVRVMQDWQDDLLPLVHKIWQPLKSKFSDENLIVVRKAYKTLLVMAEVCGDFIRKRTLDDVWPKILSFLEKQERTSCGKHSQIYTFTAVYKLQLDILQSVGRLTLHLNLPDECIDDLSALCSSYLDKNQPEGLQQAAIETFLLLSSQNADIVWLHLHNMRGSKERKELVSPNAYFPSINLYKSLDTVADNVNAILERIK